MEEVVFAFFLLGAWTSPVLATVHMKRLGSAEPLLLVAILGIWTFLVSTSVVVSTQAYSLSFSPEPLSAVQYFRVVVFFRVFAVCILAFALFVLRHNFRNTRMLFAHLQFYLLCFLWTVAPLWTWLLVAPCVVRALMFLEDDDITMTVSALWGALLFAARIEAPGEEQILSFGATMLLEGVMVACFIFTSHGRTFIGKRPVAGLII